MSNFDSDGGSDNQWDDRGDLAWNEFDWERYLREQDEAVLRYARFYEGCPAGAERIDQVAEKMGWGENDWTDDSDDDDSDDEDCEEDDVYTLHKNPIFIATKAINRCLAQSWQPLASDPSKVPQPLAVAMTMALHRAEEHAVQAIHALDFGDYAMAVSLFKRALSALNQALALIDQDAIRRFRHVQAWRAEAMPRFFDLREVWLRVMAECREELERPLDDES